MLYLLIFLSIVSLATYIWTNWYAGLDLELGTLFAMIFISILPIANIIVVICLVSDVTKLPSKIILNGRKSK